MEVVQTITSEGLIPAGRQTQDLRIAQVARFDPQIRQLWKLLTCARALTARLFGRPCDRKIFYKSDQLASLVLGQILNSLEEFEYARRRQAAQQIVLAVFIGILKDAYEVYHSAAQRLGYLNQARKRYAVGAAFIFLDLLETHPTKIGESALRKAQGKTTNPYGSAERYVQWTGRFSLVMASEPCLFD